MILSLPRNSGIVAQLGFIVNKENSELGTCQLRAEILCSRFRNIDNISEYFRQNIRTLSMHGHSVACQGTLAHFTMGYDARAVTRISGQMIYN